MTSNTMFPRHRMPLVMALLASCLTSAAASAQPRVRLELRPHAGDTLRMVVEQHTELSGSSGAGATSHSVTNRMRMTTRAIVLSRAPRSSTILSITDSVEISTSDPHGQSMVQALMKQLQGRTMRMQLSPDGTARVLGESAAPGRQADQVADLVAAMPAAFPSIPVAVGERWTRELAIPGAGGATTREQGVFRATFRLDSLSPDQSLAYISIRGEIGRNVGAGPRAGEMRGTLVGMMLLDRVRGWLADSRTSVMLHTTLAAVADGEPMKFVTHLTQRVRTLERGR